MSSNSSNLPPNDPKVIAEIVDKLKKQGLFDKFRKDCLADVDTKVGPTGTASQAHGDGHTHYLFHSPSL